MFYICTQKLNKPTTTNMLNVIAFNNNCPSEEMTNAGYNLGLVLIFSLLTPTPNFLELEHFHLFKINGSTSITAGDASLAGRK